MYAVLHHVQVSQHARRRFRGRQSLLLIFQKLYRQAAVDGADNAAFGSNAEHDKCEIDGGEELQVAPRVSTPIVVRIEKLPPQARGFLSKAALAV